MTNSFDLEFNFVIELERSDWQSSLCTIADECLNKTGQTRITDLKAQMKLYLTYKYCHLFGPTLARYT